MGQPLSAPLDWLNLIRTLTGILLLSSGSAALNQIQEQDLDARMKRTSARPLPSKRLTTTSAVTWSLGSTGLGLILLAFGAWQVTVLGALAMLLYNGMYTLWWKPKWAYAAVPGAIPGALPILMGYAAANGGAALTPGGLYLFLILFYWQMPHFWALAIRYREDYRAGGIPTLPVAHGVPTTVRQIVIWTFGYLALALLGPRVLGLSWIYFAVAAATSAQVLHKLWKFVKEPESDQWLPFFLWTTFSLIIFLGAAVVDRWSHVFARL